MHTSPPDATTRSMRGAGRSGVRCPARTTTTSRDTAPRVREPNEGRPAVVAPGRMNRSSTGRLAARAVVAVLLAVAGGALGAATTGAQTTTGADPHDLDCVERANVSLQA